MIAYTSPRDGGNAIRIPNPGNNNEQGTQPWGNFGPKQCLPGTWSNRTTLESPDECWSCPKGWKCTFGTNQLDRGDVTPIYDLDLTNRPDFIRDQYFGNRFFRPGETQAGFQNDVFEARALIG